MSKPKTTTYRIRVARMRIETLDITVDGTDDDAGRAAAEAFAIDEAESALETEWQEIPWAAGLYAPWVEMTVSQSEAKDGETTLDHIFREPLDEDNPDNRQFNYLPVLADVGVGEGRVCWQPWFARPTGLLEVDVACDWIADLRKATGDDEEPPQTPELSRPANSNGKTNGNEFEH